MSPQTAGTASAGSPPPLRTAVAVSPQTAGTAASAAVSVGAGVAEAVRAPGPGFTGRVAGVFRTGFYVAGDGGALFAVLGPGAWPGPLHLVTESRHRLPAAGDRVAAAGTVLAAGGIEIDWGGARLWDPALPDGLGFHPSVWAGAVPPVEPDLAGVWDEAKAAVRAGDLASACRQLEGRGGGLTPAGDDALAGIMLVAAADRRRRPALRRLAGRARTSDLSRAFLKWAARGSSIEPAHAVLEAAASGDRAGLARAARDLAGVGASSGRALLAGLALAVLELPARPPDPQPVVAGPPPAAVHRLARPSPAGAPLA